MVFLPLLEERRPDHEAEHRDRDEAADHGAETERRGLEELGARKALGRRRVGSGGRRGASVGLRRGRALGLDRRRLRERRARGQVSHPQEPEDKGDQGTEARDVPGDDQPDEQHDHADGEADGPQTRARDVGVFVVRLQRG